ncbi:MAG TPA: DoxX family protein, partial [Puia sp.]
WNRLESSPDEDASVYYWVRTLVRYRLALAMLAYGFIKLFPLLSPYPSISNLNTNYGDFTRWKLFSLSLGIVPSYETFLGLVEIIAALLLLYRRSASIGAAILAIFLGNVFMSNWAYGGGDIIYSLYLILLAGFILSYDAQRLANLLFFQRPASPNTFRYTLKDPWQRNTRLALKASFFLLFVVIYGFQTRHAASWQYPTTKGLGNAQGVYNVAVFKKGKDSLGYSRTDSLRWQDIVFENWATLSIRSNRPITLDSTNTEHPGLPDADRDYELQGTAGRDYFRYEVDTAKQILTLHNKNPHEDHQLVLHYDRPDSNRIILVGTDQDHDSVYAVLERRDKKYLLEEARRSGRQKGLKL